MGSMLIQYVTCAKKRVILENETVKLFIYENYMPQIFYIYGTSYGIMVLYSRDHKGVGVAHEKHHPKTSLTFPRW